MRKDTRVTLRSNTLLLPLPPTTTHHTSRIHKTPDHTISMLSMRGGPWKGVREALLTSVTPRSVSVGVGAELTHGTLEAILTNAGPVATEAIYALRAKAAPWAVRTYVDFGLLVGCGVILVSSRMEN